MKANIQFFANEDILGTWYWNKTIEKVDGVGQNFSINFTSGGNEYDVFYCYGDYFEYFSNSFPKYNIRPYDSKTKTWVNEKYREINITKNNTPDFIFEEFKKFLLHNASRTKNDKKESTYNVGGTYKTDLSSYFIFAPTTKINTFTLEGNNLQVDWGDGVKETINGSITHTYTATNEVKVIVKGVISDFSANKNIRKLSVADNDMLYFTRLFLENPTIEEVDYFDGRATNGLYDTFDNCPKLKYVKNIKLSGKATAIGFAFYHDVNLEYISDFNTENVENAFACFENCSKLKRIPKMNLAKCSNLYTTFNGCVNIEQVDCYNINANADFSACTKLQQPALHKIIDNLMQQASGTTKSISFGSALLPKISEEYKAKAKAKGWKLS